VRTSRSLRCVRSVRGLWENLQSLSSVSQDFFMRRSARLALQILRLFNDTWNNRNPSADGLRQHSLQKRGKV